MYLKNLEAFAHTVVWNVTCLPLCEDGVTVSVAILGNFETLEYWKLGKL